MTRTILLATIGSAGDVHPMIALGRELLSRGNRPILLTNDHFRQLALDNGLEFISLGDEAQYQRAVENPDLWHTVKAFNIVVEFAIGETVRPLYEAIIQFDPQTTTIVGTGFLYGAQIAYEKHGYPYITIHLQPAMFRSVHAPSTMGGFTLPMWLPDWVKHGYYNLLDAAVIDRAIGPKVNPFRAELGLPQQNKFFADNAHSPQKSLGLFPAWFAAPQADWPPQAELTGFVRYDGDPTAQLDPDLAEFIVGDKPPLVFTFGTAMMLGADLFVAAVTAAQQLGRRALLLTKYTDQIPPELPSIIRHVSYVPFSKLLPQIGVLVHHGGVGTMAQAIAAGVPQLIIPFAHDQPDNARRIKEMGMGDWLAPKGLNPAALTAKLSRLLDDASVRQNCHRRAQQIDFQANLIATCDQIEAIGQ